MLPCSVLFQHGCLVEVCLMLTGIPTMRYILLIIIILCHVIFDVAVFVKKPQNLMAQHPVFNVVWPDVGAFQQSCHYQEQHFPFLT